MITSIEIQGLRGIHEGRVEGLTPLVFLVGANGCGKSTVLEACGIACAGPSATAIFHALAGREWLGLAGLPYWMRAEGARVAWVSDAPVAKTQTRGPFTSAPRIVPARQTAQEAERTAEVSSEVRWSQGSGERAGMGWVEVDDDGTILRGSDDPGPWLPFALQSAFVDRAVGAARRLAAARFSSALRDALSTIKLSPGYDDLLSYLQILRPALTSIESIAVGDRDEPHIFERDPKHGRTGYPLAYAGDGFRRSLLLAGTFARAKGGVAAVDEPEAFAHPGILGPLTSLLRRAVADGTQVVLATHSLEFVAATLQAFEDQPTKTAVVGLRMESGVLDPIVVAGPDARRRVLAFGHDLRL